MERFEFFKQLLEEAVNAAEKEIKEDQEEFKVGAISSELLQEFKNQKKNRRELKDDAELRKEYWMRKVKRELYEEFAERIDQDEKHMEELWQKVYTELCLDPENEYSLDGITGEVALKVKSNNINESVEAFFKNQNDR
jgi:acid stress-induced BolA-like protein IbaG/YrbA